MAAQNPDTKIFDFRANIFPAFAFLHILFMLFVAIFFSFRAKMSRGTPGLMSDARTLSLLIFATLSLFFCFIGVFSMLMIQALLMSTVAVLAVYCAIAPRTAMLWLLFVSSLGCVLMATGYFPWSPTLSTVLSVTKEDCEAFYGKPTYTGIDTDKRCGSDMLMYVRVGGLFVLFMMSYVVFISFSMAVSGQYFDPLLALYAPFGAGAAAGSTEASGAAGASYGSTSEAAKESSQAGAAGPSNSYQSV